MTSDEFRVQYALGLLNLAYLDHISFCTTDVEILQCLSKHPVYLIRRKVIRNIFTSEDTLLALEQTEDNRMNYELCIIKLRSKLNVKTST